MLEISEDGERTTRKNKKINIQYTRVYTSKNLLLIASSTPAQDEKMTLRTVLYS